MFEFKISNVFQKYFSLICQLNSDKVKLFYVIDNKWEVYKTDWGLSLLFCHNKLECLVVKPPPSLTNTQSYFVIASVTEKKMVLCN